MYITVTDEGMAPHEYDKKCRCRGCVAVTKAKTRAGLIAVPAALGVAALVGFFAGHILGGLTGLVAGLLGFGVFNSLNPSKEVLKPESKNPVKVQ